MTQFTGIPLSGTGTATGACVTAHFNGLIKTNHAVQVSSTTNPAALVVAVQVTLDGTNWSSLGTSWTLGTQSLGDIATYDGYPAVAARANITTLTDKSIAAVTTGLHSDSTAAQVDAGAHTWGITRVNAAGESNISTQSTYRTADGTHTSVDITVPALSPDTAIYLYRTKAGVPASGAPTNAQWFFVADVTASAGGTYQDKTPDASLTVHPPVSNATCTIVSV